MSLLNPRVPENKRLHLEDGLKKENPKRTITGKKEREKKKKEKKNSALVVPVYRICICMASFARK
jgi:hypothetical protein